MIFTRCVRVAWDFVGCCLDNVYVLWARCLSRLIPLLPSLVCVCAPCRQLFSVMSCGLSGANPPSQPFARCCRPLSSCLFAQACRAARVRLVLSAFECPCPMLLRRPVYIRTCPPSHVVSVEPCATAFVFTCFLCLSITAMRCL